MKLVVAGGELELKTSGEFHPKNTRGFVKENEKHKNG